ncbi:MAG: hypothetical protein WCA07_15600 [Gloeobacterales cyanobacterium]
MYPAPHSICPGNAVSTNSRTLNPAVILCPTGTGQGRVVLVWGGTEYFTNSPHELRSPTRMKINAW